MITRVATVAKEDGDPHVANRYVATQRIQVDTLHYMMLFDARRRRWFVCYATNGYDFGQNGDDQNTTWTPHGASWKTVAALVDSMRQHAH